MKSDLARQIVAANSETRTARGWLEQGDRTGKGRDTDSGDLKGLVRLPRLSGKYLPVRELHLSARQLIWKVVRPTTSYKLWAEISVQVFSELIFCPSWELSRQAADGPNCKAGDKPLPGLVEGRKASLAALCQQFSSVYE